MFEDKPFKPLENREPAGSLPPDQAEFLEKVLGNSLMRYDVLRFFYENPNAILTVSDLSTWMSREEMPLTKALHELSGLGYLGQSHASSAFILTNDRERRRRLGEFFVHLDQDPDLARGLRARLHRRGEAE